MLTMVYSLIHPPTKMNMKGDQVSNWQFFKASWQNYLVATELDKKDPSIRVATFLTVMGKECYEVYQNLPLTDEQRKSRQQILASLGAHFDPKRNVVYERFMFNSCKHEPKENTDTFMNRRQPAIGNNLQLWITFG